MNTVTFVGECSCPREDKIEQVTPAEDFMGKSKIHVRCANCETVISCEKVGL